MNENSTASTLRRHEKYDRLIAAAKKLEPIATAVAHPCDETSLKGALEAGNMLAKNLTFLSHADAAGIVLGARVPIILTSRADHVRTRLASCAVAALYRHSQMAKQPIRA